MKSLFSEEAYTEIKNRIDQLSPEKKALWGKMNAPQMLAHCKGPLDISLGNLTPERPNLLVRALLSLLKPQLYNDKPWKHGLQTAKEFIITDDRDFDSEKKQLTTLIDEFHSKKTLERFPPHPIFGKFTPQQWGQMQYKHLDHHLKQFGV